MMVYGLLYLCRFPAFCTVDSMYLLQEDTRMFYIYHNFLHAFSYCQGGAVTTDSAMFKQ